MKKELQEILKHSYRLALHVSAREVAGLLLPTLSDIERHFVAETAPQICRYHAEADYAGSTGASDARREYRAEAIALEKAANASFKHKKIQDPEERRAFLQMLVAYANIDSHVPGVDLGYHFDAKRRDGFMAKLATLSKELGAHTLVQDFCVETSEYIKRLPMRQKAA